MSKAATVKRNYYSRRRLHGRVSHGFGIVMLLFCSFIFLLPLYWMVCTALKSEAYVFSVPPEWVPNPVVWDNFVRVFERMDLLKYIKNTLILSICPVIGVLFSCPMVAYSLTKIPWKGPKYIFPVILATMMIPWQVTQIPMYTIWSRLGLVDTFVPLILPSFFGSAYYIYLIRQFMKSLPSSIMEAARIDGASDIKILYYIVYPMCKSILTTIAVLVFIAGWNDLNGPLLYLQSSSKYTLSIGLQMFRQSANPEWTLLMAASTIFTLPLIVIFFLCQNAFLNGIQTTSGLK